MFLIHFIYNCTVLCIEMLLDDVEVCVWGTDLIFCVVEAVEVLGKKVVDDMKAAEPHEGKRVCTFGATPTFSD